MEDSHPQTGARETPRPWYREPWPWVLIALPAAAVVGCMISLWLALSHPDFLVVDDLEYAEIQSGIKAVAPARHVDGTAERDADSSAGTTQAPQSDQR